MNRLLAAAVIGNTRIGIKEETRRDRLDRENVVRAALQRTDNCKEFLWKWRCEEQGRRRDRIFARAERWMAGDSKASDPIRNGFRHRSSYLQLSLFPVAALPTGSSTNNWSTHHHLHSDGACIPP